MKKTLASIFAVVFFVVGIHTNAQAAGAKETIPNYKFQFPETDRDSLRRGFGYFMDSCASCHSLELMRFRRISEDLGIAKEEILEKYVPRVQAKDMFSELKTHMQPETAIEAYGVVPPDLTLFARAKGTDYILNYLLGYYVDADSKFGFENSVFPTTSMPNVLYGYQGKQVARFDGDKLVGLELEEVNLREGEFFRLVSDITNFLSYTSEPSKLQRYAYGFWILLFIAVFTGCAYLLKRELWRDIR